MGKSFHKVVLCSTNDFPPHQNDKIKGWVEHHGGKFTSKITSDTTHLLATTRAWKSYTSLVKEARQMKRVKIVSFDWLEDSLSKKPRKPLNTAKYEFEQKSIKKQETIKKKKAMPDPSIEVAATATATVLPVSNPLSSDGLDSIPVPDPEAIKVVLPHPDASLSSDLIVPPALISSVPIQQLSIQELAKDLSSDDKIAKTGSRFDRECQKFEEEMGLEGYHPYRDTTGFVYLINLVRHDILKNRVEKHALKVRVEPAPPQLVKSRISCSMYFIPPPHPFSARPAVSSNLGPEFGRSNPNLRVEIARPFAQCLQLYESDSKPHTYACFTQYTRTGLRRQIETLAPTASSWTFASDIFQKFFQRRCGIQWGQKEVGEAEEEVAKSARRDGFFQWQKDRQPKIKKPRAALILPTNAEIIVIDSDTEGEVGIDKSSISKDSIEKDLKARAKTPDQGW